MGKTLPIVDLDKGNFVPLINEDIQFGLCILKAFAELLNVNTPEIDKVATWGQNFLGKEYIVNGKLSGKDVSELTIPQNRGINTKEELIKEAEKNASYKLRYIDN